MQTRLIWLANGIVFLHVSWLLAMVTGPFWAPWWLILAAGAVVAVANIANRGRCPLTTREFSLRRRATEQAAFFSDELYGAPRRGKGWDYHKERMIYIVRAEHVKGGFWVTTADYIPSHSMMGRLIATPAFLCGGNWYPSEVLVGRITKVMLVLLPLAAYLREVWP